MEAIKRIHHISAIVGDPNENVKFYRDVLGLSLVKQTVNFDDPGVYHLYFADHRGTPGTVITFFPWPNKNYGRKGSGQVGRIAFRVPKGSLDYWKEHLTAQELHVKVTQLFGKDTLEFDDIHGLELAIVEGEITAAHKDIIGFHGSVLLSANPEGTEELLTGLMGLKVLDTHAGNHHYETTGEEKHHIIISTPPKPAGRFGIGTVHHIAWSVPDMDVLKEWQSTLRREGFGVTVVKDRSYFKSIYTGEKGNVVFEFATDGPGFEIDEDMSSLGTALKLPEQYEHKRQEYEKLLPKLDI
ncbi:VOC family protein [Virgibacillus halodenitrificans]|uniref:VOC family protein n=1 Tax=Virgibacillus halodenitrificans TaxID=1482 RepID=UPI001F473E18|nr:VOC family protein [Virgibacillus halodenitrificans]MCG1028845.1 VOC family protein [Virgibacillus halodenitrificans]